MLLELIQSYTIFFFQRYMDYLHFSVTSRGQTASFQVEVDDSNSSNYTPFSNVNIGFLFFNRYLVRSAKAPSALHSVMLQASW